MPEVGAFRGPGGSPRGALLRDVDRALIGEVERVLDADDLVWATARRRSTIVGNEAAARPRSRHGDGLTPTRCQQG